MGLQRTVDATVEPLTAVELRTHSRVDEQAEDALLDDYIKAARQLLEIKTGRAFLSQTWVWKMDQFWSGIVYLPRPPLIAVSSIGYTDTDGASQTWSSDEYTVDTTSDPGRIAEAYSYTFPSTRDVIDAVTVTYTAGYGTATSDLPEGIVQAVRFLAAHWYERREPIAPANMVAKVPLAVESLIWAYKMPEVF